MQELDIVVSEYFDSEISLSKRLNYEAEMLNRINLKEYMQSKYFDYYQISKSIRKIKRRLSNLR